MHTCHTSVLATAVSNSCLAILLVQTLRFPLFAQALERFNARFAVDIQNVTKMSLHTNWMRLREFRKAPALDWSHEQSIDIRDLEPQPQISAF
jgi:hypothetical protein